MSAFRSAFLLVAMLVCACDRPAPEVQASSNAKPAWPEGRAWRFASEASVVIGEADGTPEYQFNHIAAAMVVADSLIVVGDQWAGQVHYYTRRGAHVKTAGRYGNGPGEYRNIAWIGAHGDSVVVWDPFTARVTVLTPDGSLARTVRAADADGHLYLPAGMLNDGSLLLREPDDRRLPYGEHVDSMRYVRVSTSSGAVLGRLGPFLLGERFTGGDDRTNITTWVVFGGRGVVVGAPNGILVGTTDRFELSLRDSVGRPVRSFGRAWKPRLATDADVAAVIEQRRAAPRASWEVPEIERVERAMDSHLPHRDTLPAFTRALVDDGGNVWMEEFRIDPAATGTWSVFDPGGRRLGQVQTPADVKVMSIGRDAMVGVTKDELDVERVVAYPLLR